jgi:hypothetical protein
LSMPGNPAFRKFCRQPRSSARDNHVSQHKWCVWSHADAYTPMSSANSHRKDVSGPVVWGGGRGGQRVGHRVRHELHHENRR